MQSSVIKLTICITYTYYEFYVRLKHSFLLTLQYVLLYIEEGCDPVNKLYYCDMTALPNGLATLRNENALLPFVKLIDNFDAQYQAIANDDSVFTFLTNKYASKYKLVRVDLKEPTVWSDVLPESENDVLESACAVNGNQMIVSYLSDVKYVLQVRDLKTGSLHHQLPIDIGSVFGISARREDSVVFIGFTSFLTPGIIYQCNLENEVPHMKIFREISVPGFDRSEFHVNQVNKFFPQPVLYICIYFVPCFKSIIRFLNITLFCMYLGMSA